MTGTRDCRSIEQKMTIELAAQGSFYFGFEHITAPGELDLSDLRSNTGEIFPIHQGYVRFQRPVRPRKYPLVMVHGAGQTRRTGRARRAQERGAGDAGAGR